LEVGVKWSLHVHYAFNVTAGLNLHVYRNDLVTSKYGPQISVFGWSFHSAMDSITNTKLRYMFIQSVYIAAY